MKTAKQMAKQLQDLLDEQKVELRSLGIEKVTIQGAFDHFKQINSDKHPKTLYEYDWFYERFSETFQTEDPCTVINKRSTEAWLSTTRLLPYSKNTLHSYCKVLRKFLGFLFEYSYTPVFKINKDVILRPEVKAIITFSDDDIKTFFESLGTKNNNFQTTMYLLFYTGLRPSDIYNISVADIDFERSIFQYYSEKSKEHFIVPIHDELIPILKSRCEEIVEGGLLNYKKISNIGKAFRRYIDEDKIKLTGKGYNLRTFRKTFISLAHDGGMDLATVSKLVGHRQITTTAKFYHKLNISKQTTELNKLVILKKEQQNENQEK